MSTEAAAGGSYLIETMRRYAAFVLSHKQRIEERLAGQKNAEAQGEAVELLTDEEMQSRAAEIQRDLRERLDEIGQEILRRGDEREQRRYRELQYVMVAFTDEIFLSLSWEGQDFWREHLLEERIFASHHAGTQFFHNIDELLRQRDPTFSDVAAGYLLALSLGFRGRYQGLEGESAIERYRQQLFAFLFQRNSGLGEDVQLYPQSYAYTLTGKPQSWLPVLRPWLFAIAAVLGLYVLVGHVIWSHESSRISRMIDDLRDSQRTAKTSDPSR
jgi:type VI secretion system protein ImpK